MTDSELSRDRLQACIDRLHAGDAGARDELLAHASSRLIALTRKMSRDFRRVGRWEQSEDICQNATVRLWNSLKSVHPRTAADFYRLAALQIRRELIDLARSLFGPEGLGANHASNEGALNSGSADPPPYDRDDSAHRPDRVASWSDFHQQADALPEEPRAAFDLLWYQGLTQAEAAEVLGVSEPTLKRRWREARVLLCQALDGEPPG